MKKLRCFSLSLFLLLLPLLLLLFGEIFKC
jgi:hypothetical protein